MTTIRTFLIDQRLGWPERAALGLYIALPTAMVIIATLSEGLPLSGGSLLAARIVISCLLAAYTGLAGWGSRRAIRRWSPLGGRLIEWAVLTGLWACLGLAWSSGPGSRAEASWDAAEIGILTLMMYQWLSLSVLAARRYERPGLLLIGSMGLLIGLGTGALMLPAAVPPGDHITPLDALFTATSATCSTGLTVRETATRLSPFGQLVVLILMEAGALAAMIFGSLLALMAGASFIGQQSVGVRRLLGGSSEDAILHLPRVVRFAVAATFLIQLIGGAIFFFSLPPAQNTEHQILHAAFMAVSAFTNTGLTVTEGGIARYSLLSHLVLPPLILLGVVGLPVLYNLSEVLRSRWQRWRNGNTPVRMNLQSRLVLTTLAMVYIVGTLLLITAQVLPRMTTSLPTAAGHEQMSAQAVSADIATSGLLSITRTTGFQPVPPDQMTGAAKFVLLPMMFIGGSPGSPIGGAKTLTIALFVLIVLATMRQNRPVEAFGRSLPLETVRLAVILVLASAAMTLLATLLLCWSEPYAFVDLLFESTSAASNSGLSMGITQKLTKFGKVVIIATMVLGRVGPLWLLSVVALRQEETLNYAYPEESVALG